MNPRLNPKRDKTSEKKQRNKFCAPPRLWMFVPPGAPGSANNCLQMENGHTCSFGTHWRMILSSYRLRMCWTCDVLEETDELRQRSCARLNLTLWRARTSRIQSSVVIL